MSVVARRYYLRGKHSLQHGDLGQAIDTLQSAVDLAPGFAAARVAHAVALAGFGDCQRAAQSLRAGLARPNSPAGLGLLWATLGDVLTQSGDLVGAEDAYGQADDVPGFEGRAASGRARVYARMGRYGDAFNALAAVARLNHDLGE